MFRFTIRDLLWLTLVAALVAGWFRERQLRDEAHRAQLQADTAVVEARIERDNAMTALQLYAPKDEAQYLLKVLRGSKEGS